MVLQHQSTAGLPRASTYQMVHTPSVWSGRHRTLTYSQEWYQDPDQPHSLLQGAVLLGEKGYAQVQACSLLQLSLLCLYLSCFAVLQ